MIMVWKLDIKFVHDVANMRSLERSDYQDSFSMVEFTYRELLPTVISQPDFFYPVVDEEI